MTEATAVTICVELVTAGLFFTLGELNSARRERRRERAERDRASKVNRYTWEELLEGADRIGEEVFSKFKADVVLSFAGPAAVFANLVIARHLDRKELSKIRLINGKFIEKDADPELALLSDFDLIVGERLDVLLPRSLAVGDRSWRIAVLDETVTTGSSMRAIKGYLNDCGYQHVCTACFVCCETARTIDPHSVDYAAVFNVDNKFTLPWGKSPL